MNHTVESCLFPIGGDGVHKLQQGSRGAIRLLTNLLHEFPNDLAAQWLLNIGFMTVGEYPEKVPPQWLIPPQTFASDYDLKPFRDVAPGLGLDSDGLAGGVILDDFDGDGDLDLVNSSWGYRDQLRFFCNNGDGTFTERTKEAGLLGITGGLNLVQADYNNDGHIDFLVLRGAWFGGEGRIPNSLIRNNGNGTFDDVTEASGVLSFHPTQTATWVDYNGDGWIDLFIGNESTGNEIHPCELYRNNRDGSFTESAEKAGLAFVGFVKGVASGDYNNDGRPDLYLSCQNQGNQLFRNEGPGGRSQDSELGWNFTEVSVTAGVREPIRSFPTWFWDYDNDGWLDIFVSGYRLAGLGDIAADCLNLPHNSDGIAFGDIDHDGDQDIYEDMGGAFAGDNYRNVLYENPGHGNNWIKLKLEGVKSNRSGIGARIKFVVPAENGERAIYKTVNSGGSFGASPLRQEIGLGKASSIKSLEIFWPVTGKTQVFKDVAVNQFYRVREDSTAPVRVELKSFKLSGRPGANGHHHN